jgi:hypothetical protein
MHPNFEKIKKISFVWRLHIDIIFCF